MEKSKIEWCDATVNMWWGCTKVSPGCAHCYADTLAHRWGKEIWGPGKQREDHRAGATKLAMRLARAAAAGRFRQCSVCGKREIRKGDGIGLVCCSNPDCTALPETESDPVRPRVFSASMADWLDDEVPIEWLVDLLRLIHRTKPYIDWLLLSKRPQNWLSRCEAACDYMDAQKMNYGWIEAWVARRDSFFAGPQNVWIGTTVEDQQRADERIPRLLSIPAKVRFLSCEPLLGPVDVRFGFDHLVHPDRPTIHWVIAGGESGPGARPMHPDWARSLRDQCQAAGVPFLFKQWGEWAPAATTIKDRSHLLQRDGKWTDYSDCFHMPHQIRAMEADGVAHLERHGKALAGRILDGREWNEFPAAMV